MTTGQRIHLARKQAKLSQKELGEKLGVSGSMIGQYENDQRRPKIQTLRKLATALHTTVGYLLVDEMADVVDENDREFLEALPPIKPLEELPLEVQAINMLLHSSGELIFRVDEEYYFSSSNGVSSISSDDVSDMITASMRGLSVAKDILLRRLKKESFQSFVQKGITNGEHTKD